MAKPVEGKSDHCVSPDAHPTRRAVIQRGVKLAFVAPLLSTFFAKNAYAASYSCYPAGHACGLPGQEPCCGTPCTANVCPP